MKANFKTDNTAEILDDSGKVIASGATEEIKKQYPQLFDIAASVAKIMDRVNILSEFRDELCPIQAGAIAPGDRVYVRPLRVMGEVLRIVDDTYRVRVNVNGENMVNSYWGEEVERR